MAHKVFICHSSNDKQVADAACAALEAQRIPCWIAPRDVLPGMEYGKAIVQALSDCEIVLLVFSAHANESPQVRREIERAVSKGKIILPFRIENVLPSDAMEFALSNTHWLDALTPPLESYLVKLCEAAGRLLQQENSPPLWQKQQTIADEILAGTESEEAPVVMVKTGAETPVRRRILRWPWGGLAALVTVAALVLAFLWINKPNPHLLRTLEGHSSPVNSVAFTPDGRTLASGSADATIKAWDPASGELQRNLQEPNGWAVSVAFALNGHTLAAGNWNNTIDLWDAPSGQLLATLSGHTDHVVSVAFSPDGQTLASGSWDKTVMLWNLASGHPLRTLKGHTAQVLSVAFSPLDGTLASGSGDATIKMWNPESGQLLRTLKGHSSAVYCVAFSPDGRTLASGSWDKTIKLWDVASGKLLHTLLGHTQVVWSVAFSPDGRTLASGSRDETIKLWDVANGKLSNTLLGHTGDVWSVAFSPDGRTLASGSQDTTIKLWSMH